MAEQSNNPTRRRRTHLQALAHKRYPRMTFIDGNGEWIAMTMCPALNNERQRWSYRLFAMQHQAQVWLETMNTMGCDSAANGETCFGKDRHRIWKIS